MINNREHELSSLRNEVLTAGLDGLCCPCSCIETLLDQTPDLPPTETCDCADPSQDPRIGIKR